MLKRTYSCMTSSSETLNANCACAPAAVHSADKKTTRYFEALGEAVDVDYEAYCWRRSGFFWRTRASLGLACAQATALCTHAFGKARPRSRARDGATSPDFGSWSEPPPDVALSPLFVCLFFLLVRVALKLRSLGGGKGWVFLKILRGDIN